MAFKAGCLLNPKIPSQVSSTRGLRLEGELQAEGTAYMGAQRHVQVG